MRSDWLRLLVRELVAVNTGLPLILETVETVGAAVRLATGGEGPTTLESARIIREEIASGQGYGVSEIARMDALIAQQAQVGL